MTLHAWILTLLLLSAVQDKKTLEERMVKAFQSHDSPVVRFDGGVAEMARLFADLEKAIDKYTASLPKDEKAAAKLRLNTTDVNKVRQRKKWWNGEEGGSSTYPFIDMGKNRDYKKWITNSSIQGKRILVKNTPGAELRWRILVVKYERDDGKMKAWLQQCAKDLLDPGEPESGRKLNPSQWDAIFGAGAHADALRGHNPKGWQIHHKIPLYVGQANGGTNQETNFYLVSDDEHKKRHQSGGYTYNKWGPPAIYVTAGKEKEPDPDE